jgi:acyl-coenzyme A thioesterase PaaI-like protein
MNYDVDGDSVVRATFECDHTFEGYPGMVHGGVISSILDGAMGNCMFAHGLATVPLANNMTSDMMF